MTMNISRAKIDDKGRIQLPNHFLKANNIEVGTYVIIQPVYNNKSACKLEFNNEEQRRKESSVHNEDSDKETSYGLDR